MNHEQKASDDRKASVRIGSFSAAVDWSGPQPWYTRRCMPRAGFALRVWAQRKSTVQVQGERVSRNCRSPLSCSKEGMSAADRWGRRGHRG
jgi:hypothetical protein